jgi:L-rhamnose mutarotase
MSQHVLTVNLRDDPAAIATYCEYHTRVFPEVLERLRAVGVRRMDIHLLGRQLVMVVEVNDGLDIRRVFEAHRQATGRVEEWERLMKSLQEPVPGAPDGEWWAVMEPVFHLS